MALDKRRQSLEDRRSDDSGASSSASDSDSDYSSGDSNDDSASDESDDDESYLQEALNDASTVAIAANIRGALSAGVPPNRVAEAVGLGTAGRVGPPRPAVPAATHRSAAAASSTSAQASQSDAAAARPAASGAGSGISIGISPAERRALKAELARGIRALRIQDEVQQRMQLDDDPLLRA